MALLGFCLPETERLARAQTRSVIPLKPLRSLAPSHTFASSKLAAVAGSLEGLRI